MSESILLSVKQNLGLAEDYTAFDFDVLTHINTALGFLHDLGIGPAEGVYLEDESPTWDDLLTDTVSGPGASPILNSVKSYVYLRVRLLFDPPNTSFLVKAMEEQLREMEWRILRYRESKRWTNPLSQSVDEAV
jgi:hypothetical protein